MLIQPDPAIQTMRGHLNGSQFVFFPRGNRQFARDLVQPANPDTGPQQTVRTFMATIAAGFSALSDANRQTWTDITSFFERVDKNGNPYTLSDRQVYSLVNFWRLCDGQTLSATAPSPTQPTPVLTVANPVYTAASGTLQVDITQDAGHPTEFAICKVTPAFPSPQSRPRPSDYRLVSGPDTESIAGRGVTASETLTFTNSLTTWTNGDTMVVTIQTLSAGYVPGLTNAFVGAITVV